MGISQASTPDFQTLFAQVNTVTVLNQAGQAYNKVDTNKAAPANLAIANQGLSGGVEANSPAPQTNFNRSAPALGTNTALIS